MHHKGLVLHGVQPDGSLAPDDTIAYIVGDLDRDNAPYVDEAGEPVCVITLRPISGEKLRQVNRKHTRREVNKFGRIVEDTDTLAVSGELIEYAIVDWTGLVTSDGVPVQCTPAAKRSLSLDRRAHVLQAAIRRESAEVDSASFREST